MSLQGKLKYILLAALVLVLDLGSKSWAFQYVADHGSPTPLHGDSKAVTLIDGFFYLTRVYNPGGIWGIGQEGILSKALVIIRILAVPAILFMILRTPRNEVRFLMALSLFCAGAVGNLYDNLTTGGQGVRDFLDFFLVGENGYHWPTFNIADSGIVCGVGLLLLDMILPKRTNPAVAAASPGGA